MGILTQLKMVKLMRKDLQDMFKGKRPELLKKCSHTPVHML